MAYWPSQLYCLWRLTLNPEHVSDTVISGVSFIYFFKAIEEKKIFRLRILDPDQEFYAVIPIEQNIAWIWALVFAFAVPEVGTFIRAARISFFRNVSKANWHEFGLVGINEILMYVVKQKHSQIEIITFRCGFLKASTLWAWHCLSLKLYPNWMS